MLLNRALRTFVLAALLGCLWWLVLLLLEPNVSLLASPMVKTVRSIGVTEQATFRVINRAFWIIVWALVSGLIFGLPLGAVARSRWVRASVVFIVAAIGSSLGFALAGEFGLSEFLSPRNLPGQAGLAGFLWDWAMPEPWTALLTVALFVWLGYRLRGDSSREHRVAP